MRHAHRVLGFRCGRAPGCDQPLGETDGLPEFGFLEPLETRRTFLTEPSSLEAALQVAGAGVRVGDLVGTALLGEFVGDAVGNDVVGIEVGK